MPQSSTGSSGFIKKEDSPAPPIVRQKILQLYEVYFYGEKNYEENYIYRLISSISPEMLDDYIGDTGKSVRALLELIQKSSGYINIRCVVDMLLPAPSDSEPPPSWISANAKADNSQPNGIDYSQELLYPHQSRSPISEQAIEVLIIYLNTCRREGNTDIWKGDMAKCEQDLLNALEFLKGQKHRGAPSLLVQVVTETSFDSVRAKARDVLAEY